MKKHRYDSKKFAVVTGASSGIGFELAKQFAENGFDLLITGEDAGIEEAAVMIRDEVEDQVDVMSLQVDLAESAGVDALYEEIRGVGRPVDAIAINTGGGSYGSFVETDLGDELEIIARNVTSTVHLAKLVVQDMVDWGSGRVLFTSSISAILSLPLPAIHAATKAFIHSFAENLRDELRDKGVSVTAMLPGANPSPFLESASSDSLEPSDVARQGFEVLMGRGARKFPPEDSRAPH